MKKKMCGFVLWILTGFFLMPQILLTSPCAVKGNPGNWYLEVNGKPFILKGVGCSRIKGKSGVHYLHIAKQLGANTVRTWGIDKGNKEYLDAADKQVGWAGIIRMAVKEISSAM